MGPGFGMSKHHDLDTNSIKSDPTNSKNVWNLLKPDGLGGEEEWIVPLVELE
jgi:hypothetical protein